MKFFLDTANVDEVREAESWGVISGVTTNPSLVAKEGRDFRTVVQEICGIVQGPVSAEVVSLDSEGMVTEGRELAGWDPQVVVKLPMTPAGLTATRILRQDGIRVNMTLVFTVPQALLAARAGAAFVSPFIGRLDDNGQDGMNLVRDLAPVIDLHRLPTEIIAASIRNPLHVVEAAKAGAHIATVPFKVLQKLIQHPLTDQGIAQFLADWQKATAKQ